HRTHLPHRSIRCLSHNTPPTHLYPLSLHDALPIFLLANISSMAAQKDKKKKKDDAKSTDSSKVVLPMGDEQQIDYMLSEMLGARSEEHTSELQSRSDLVCRLLLEKKNINIIEYQSV